MAVTAPEWLTKRGGELRCSHDGHSCAVLLRGEPQYLVLEVPAGGKHGCHVKQSNNAKRLDSGATYQTPDDAVRGGLEDLRKALGW